MCESTNIDKRIGNTLCRTGLTTKEAILVRKMPYPYYHCRVCTRYFLLIGFKTYEYVVTKWVRLTREFEKPEHVVFT